MNDSSNISLSNIPSQQCQHESYQVLSTDIDVNLLEKLVYISWIRQCDICNCVFSYNHTVSIENSPDILDYFTKFPEKRPSYMGPVYPVLGSNE